ncbi:glutathione S-transferase C-terminal domain-containing protein [Glutamicibacter sp. FBE19]|uniref:glutathione S-transferase C-terminal domain-containing protein n=1 Tax=Glutamicibacter sp. FBE19 TaxID=2761534 RepID=UPI0018968E2C|nr:glutathione S-transferase C-terminal domain-containing protein [Glutamicibacter sp. FBE19]MBF6672894.1 glutathione S-transferase C-terminal domain-containing protein [Glutamicibacter sp. FBE19]
MSEEYSTKGAYVTGGEFTRDTNYIQDRIVADANPANYGSEHNNSKIGHPDAGVSEGAQLWPVEAGRYRLVAARACPWANRTLIVRRILGLEDALSVGLPGPTHDARSWTFDLDPSGKDPVLGTERIQENYFKRFADYPRGITVPAIVDIPTGAVVTNDYPQITWDLSTQWKEFHREGAPNLIPQDQLEEMLPLIKRIFTEVNNGVYRAGFAGSQSAYNDAYDRLFATLDFLEERLSTRRFLMGDHITEADVRLFTTLVRFDPVYHGHFKTNRNKLIEMPNLWGYARDLFQTPGFGDTIDFEQIKAHYYVVHEDINPTQIIPKGPVLENWLEAPERERLADQGPWLEGTAPAPVRPQERVQSGHNPLYPAELAG